MRLADTTPRPLLLGESPSKAGDRFYEFPLSGRPSERICEIMGWPGDGAAYWRVLERFDTMNVIERYRDSTPWSVQRARDRWTTWLLTEHYEKRREPLIVVCLGRRAAEAVGLGSRPFGYWLEAGLLQAVAAPHTSGRSRLWNDPGTVDVLRRILLESLHRASLIAERA